MLKQDIKIRDTQEMQVVDKTEELLTSFFDNQINIKVGEPSGNPTSQSTLDTGYVPQKKIVRRQDSTTTLAGINTTISYKFKRYRRFITYF